MPNPNEAYVLTETY